MTAKEKKEAVYVLLVRTYLTNAEIAARIGTTEQVVKNMTKEIYIAKGVESRVQMVLLHNEKLITNLRSTASELARRCGAEVDPLLMGTRE